MHPLKLVCIFSWAALFVGQLSLLLPPGEVEYFWVILLAVPLLLPLRGLISDAAYTYKWIGFLTLVYFCIGVSELVVNPALKIYGYTTVAASLALFLASIYYARFLGLRGPD